MAESSVHRALAMPEIRHLILMRLDRSDWVRCARINKTWHENSIEYLWKGHYCSRDTSVTLGVLAALVSDLTRFEHYVRHVRHISDTSLKPVGQTSCENSILNEAEYLSILKPDLWASTTVRSLWLSLKFGFQDHKSAFSQQPPIPLLQPSLRVLNLSDFKLNEEFFLASKRLSLRGLYLDIDNEHSDGPQLCDMIRNQQNLVALALRLSKFSQAVDDALVAQVGELPRLRHFQQSQCSLAVHRLSYPKSAGFTKLESLIVRGQCGSLSLLGRENLPALRKVRVVWHSGNASKVALDSNLGLSGMLLRLSSISTIEEASFVYMIRDKSEKLDMAIREFARASPHLRQFNLLIPSSRGYWPISGDTLDYIADACPLMEALSCNIHLKEDMTSVVTNLLRKLPDLVELGLMGSYELWDLLRLPILDPKPRLRKLRLHRTHSGNGHDSSSAESQRIFDFLSTRLPHLQYFGSNNFYGSAIGDASYLWNDALRSQPKVKGMQSTVLQQIEEDMLL